jgi:methionyl-tRNA formyltransferase
MRLAFLGTPDFAVPTLLKLIEHGHDLACVYCQPPRPKGRGLALEMAPVAQAASTHGIEIRTPTSLRNSEEQARFSALRLDAAVVVAYGLILPQPILDAPKLGCFNLHASLLPRWRGAAPIQRAIMEGDAETAVVVMRMEAALDTGPVLMEERTPIGRKTFGMLHDELSGLGAGLMVRALAALERGAAVEAKSQTNIGATYAKKISNAESHIDWTRPASEVDRQIRGLSPSPGAWCNSPAGRIKVLYAEPAEGRGLPGEVLDERLLVACGKGAVRLARLQRAGRGVMDAADFLRGFALGPGGRLS